MSKSNTNLFLKYQGVAVDNGSMDAYKTAASIFAFTEFIQKSGRIYFGNKAKMKIEVKAFKHGSFAIEFGFDLLGILATLFSLGLSVSDFVETLKLVFDFYKFTGGEEPKSTANIDGDQIQVTNCNGDVRIFNHVTINIASNEEVNKALDACFVQPLNEEGIDTAVLMNSKNEVIAGVDQSNKDYFKVPNVETIESSNDVKKLLFIEAPNLIKLENKWKMNDGINSFSVSIEDAKFLEKVNHGIERFGVGDSLLVTMREEQVRTGSHYSIKRTILEVLEHREGCSQSDMFHQSDMFE